LIVRWFPGIVRAVSAENIWGLNLPKLKKNVHPLVGKDPGYADLLTVNQQSGKPVARLTNSR
jgi:hypothetical protein